MERSLHPATSASSGLKRLVLLFGLGAIGAALTVGRSTQQTGGTAAPPVPREAFSHGAHVPSVWFYRGAGKRGGPTDTAHEFDKQEVARDCRGCHDFGERNDDGTMRRQPRSPLETCTSCHYGGVLVREVQPGFEVSLRAGRGSLSAFEHLDHDALACRECHESMNDDQEIDLPGRTGVPACVECHTEGGEDRRYEPFDNRTIDRSKIRSGFLAWLNAEPSMQRAGRGPYPHDAHLSAEELADPAACAACHGDVGTAKADDLHLHEYTAAACAECHVQSDGAPIAVDRTVELRSSSAALTFSHADHLGTSATPKADAARRGAHTELQSTGCLACHEHSVEPVRAPDGSAMPPTFVLRDDRKGYLGCMSCHDVPRFRAPNHGEWGSCTSCHSFGEGDLKSLRPQTAVERAIVGEVRFLMPAQRHPGISGTPDQACADCHRAPLPETPSRIAGQRFDHASHLDSDPTAQDCQVCHTSVASAAGPTAIGLAWDEARAGLAPAAQLLTFDLASCGSCHPGIALDPASLTTRTRREVPTFSHADHLASAIDPRTEQPVTCTSCHDFEAGVRGTGIGVNDTARTCVQCHKHDEAHAPWTGGIFGPAVESCASCHISGEPRVKEQLEVPRVRVALQGPQHHPLEQGCWECHQEEKPGELKPVTAVLATFPLSFRSPHGDGRGRPPDCSSCHWAIRKNSVSSEQRVTGTLRELIGKDLANFPGGRERSR